MVQNLFFSSVDTCWVWLRLVVMWDGGLCSSCKAAVVAAGKECSAVFFSHHTSFCVRVSSVGSAECGGCSSERRWMLLLCSLCDCHSSTLTQMSCVL